VPPAATTLAQFLAQGGIIMDNCPGVLFMFVVLIRALGGQFSARHHEAVEACSFYWHFVDVVWIALFTTLYVFG